MPVYEIEQYEVHAQTYRVEAASEAEAIVKLFDGLAEPVDNSLELIELCEDLGLPVDENRDLADALRSAGIPVGDDVIPTIRSIEEIE